MKRATALICGLREIGVAFVVLFALNAAAASPAWAVAELNPEQAPAVIRGINLAGEKLEFNLQGNSEKFKIACEFGAIEGKNIGGFPQQIIASLTFSGLTYVQDGLLCPASNGTKKTDGELTDKTSLWASIWLEDTTAESALDGHTYTLYDRGSVVHLQAS